MNKFLNKIFSKDTGVFVSDERVAKVSDEDFVAKGPIPYFDLCRVAFNFETQKNITKEASSREDPKPDESNINRKAANGNHIEVSSVEQTRYEIGDSIGEGGTAIVYRAFDTTMKREVAIKRFHTDLNQDEEDSDYTAEIDSISRIQHPNVVNTFDAGLDSKSEYIVMELIEGEDLEHMLKNKSLDLNTFAELAEQAMEGLLATHEAGVLHLDLKPSNMMVTPYGNRRIHLKLIDYGRAKLISSISEESTKKSSLKGSIHIMSPEQLSNKLIDVRSDVYSLGCVFYYLLTKKYPFQGDNAIQIMAAHLQGKFVSLREVAPELPSWLCDWVEALIAKDPKNRPQSVDEAIELFIQGERGDKVQKLNG